MFGQETNVDDGKSTVITCLALCNIYMFLKLKILCVSILNPIKDTCKNERTLLRVRNF